MLVTSPGMKPGAIRVDQLDREQEDEKVIKYPEIGKKHALKKYDQFTQNTSCFWRSTGNSTISRNFFYTKIMNK